MSTRALFIHGAGRGAHAADEALVASLRRSLGPAYAVHHPVMPREDAADDALWQVRIASALAAMNDPVLLLGHSVGASILLKFLAERAVARTSAGIFLLAAPLWGGEGWRYEGFTRLALPEGCAATLPKGAPVFLYHGRDDEVVPFAHLGLYARRMPLVGDHAARATATGAYYPGRAASPAGTPEDAIGSARPAAAGGTAAQAARAHQVGQRLERQRVGDAWQDRGLVFATAVGTPIMPRNLDRHYKATLRRAGLPDRRLHDLRHTFATLMFRRGLDVTMVSRMLGHASIQITIDIDIHWLPKDSSEAATIGDAFLRGRGERPSAQ